MGFWDVAEGALNYATPAGLVGKLTGAYDYGGAVHGAASELNNALEGNQNNEFRNTTKDNFLLPGYADRNQRLLGYQGQTQGRAAPQAADSNFRNSQQALVNLLGQQAMGKGPSLAAMQGQQLADRNIAQQQAFAASARPGQQALAARTASQNVGNINSGLAGQQQMAMLQERLGAAGQLGGVLQGARGQDLQRALANAGMQQQQTGMNDQRLLDLLRQEQANAALQQQGGMGYEQTLAQKFNSLVAQPTGTQQILSGGAGLLAGLL